ncbi:Uncharacterized protein PCOAH_00009780 [Plasmodium coatneyi]|uniref:Plasmodium RESA N-terminal domain-containing protein n=1 Tax=Plasmodium coatneyi TaxID=208452 RepID=A0A1B1DUK7_9APIC|nr:Uncharacterized protein PCOAH_00009780 [Plasmodium coatneyi]ANQ06424.1 Uncharacterized protein PCOAH_00009780 [Plasmodium coatneyi]
MENTRRKFFSNRSATPQKVSICPLLIMLLLHPTEILHSHANANSYLGLSCSNGERSFSKPALAQLQEFGDVGREAQAELTEDSTYTPVHVHQMPREIEYLTPPKSMDTPSSTSTNNHIPIEPKTINQRHMNFSTSDDAFFQLRLKINNYINEKKLGQTKHYMGNVKTKENVVKNLKVFERELKEQMNSLYFYVSKKDMYQLWVNIYDKRRHVYIDMIKTLWEKCVHITEKKQIPEKFLFKVWWKAYSDFVDELQNYDSQNLSSFYDLYNKDRCSRYTFMQFIMENKKSWEEFTKRMKNKWTKVLLDDLRGYSK